MKRTLVSLLLLSPIALSLGVTILGCGSGGFNNPVFGGTSSSGTQSNSNTQVPATFSGKVLIRSVSLLPAPVASLFEERRAAYESEGFFLSSNARVLAHPTAPAASWSVELGSQKVLVGADGSFTLQPPTDGATEGVFRHPSDPNLIFRFTAADLGRAKAAGSSIVLPILLGDPCKMRNDADVFCAAPVRTKVDLPRPTEPDGFRPRLRPYNFPRSISLEDFRTKKRLGTYPAGSSVECFIQDGRLDTPAIPDSLAETVAGDLLGIAKTKIEYLGSTCDVYVLAGACPNENPATDRELAEFRQELSEAPELTRALWGSDVPILETVPGKQVHCDQNHKRRSCTQVVIGDVACELPTKEVIHANESAVIMVQPGSQTTFTLHNNGVYGLTKIVKEKSEADGKLINPGGKVGLFPPEVPLEVRHYTPVDYNPNYEAKNTPSSYDADREVVYRPGANALVGQEDIYRFVVDDKAVTLTFRIKAASSFLTRLGSTSELTVQDLNAAGTLTTLRDDKTYLEPLGADRVELLAQPGGALLNDEGVCLYQATDHQSHARYRFPDGQITDLEPPAGSLSQFADGIASLSPQGFYFCKAKRADGKNDFFTAVEGGGGKQFVNAPEGLAPSTEVTPLTDTTKDALYANAPGGRAEAPSPFEGLNNAGKLARFDFTTRNWTSEIVPLRPDFLPGFGSGARYVGVSSDNVLYTESGENWYRTPPQGVTWAQFFIVLLQNGGRETEHRKSEIRGPGARPVFSSEDPLYDDNRDPIPAGTSHTVVGMNDDLEVVGTITESNRTRPVIFENGNSTDLVPLLPPGAPAGDWTPLKIAGRYMILQHTDGTGSSLYLWFRGNQN